MQVDSSPVPLKRCPRCGEMPVPNLSINTMLFTYECPNEHLNIEIDALAGTFTRCRAWNKAVDDLEAMMEEVYASKEC